MADDAPAETLFYFHIMMVNKIFILKRKVVESGHPPAGKEAAGQVHAPAVTV